MVLGIGGGGSAGLALEVTPGTYLAPTKFFRFNSEAVTYKQNTNWRRPIGLNVGVLGPVPGDAHVEGDIDLGSECLEDVIVYFLLAARTSCVKSGVSPNFTYTFTPSSTAVPAKTLSINIERVEDEIFGYTGLVVSSFRFGITDGMLTFACSLVGRDEATQAEVVPTFPTSTPFGAGMFTVEIPTGSVVLDADTFEFVVEDNATPNFRMKSTGRGAEHVTYGERNCTTNFERDFLTKTDYAGFKAYTAQALKVLASKGADNSIQIDTPASVKDTYEVGLSAQGDLVRAGIAYQNTGPTGNEYTIVVKTQEDITLP